MEFGVNQNEPVVLIFESLFCDESFETLCILNIIKYYILSFYICFTERILLRKGEFFKEISIKEEHISFL